MTTNAEASSCDIKAKRNKKQVCFSDKELEKYESFLKEQGKFSLYVKRLIEEDYNKSMDKTTLSVDLSALEGEIRDLKAIMLDEFKKINNAPQIVEKQPTEEQKQDIKKVINEADEKRERNAMNSFSEWMK